METVETLTQKITSLGVILNQVRDFISNLQAGHVMTQEELDTLGAALAVEVAKADALDEPQP